MNVFALINDSNYHFVTTNTDASSEPPLNAILVDGVCCGAIVANITVPNWSPAETSIFTISRNASVADSLCFTLPLPRTATRRSMASRTRSPRRRCSRRRRRSTRAASAPADANDTQIVLYVFPGTQPLQFVGTLSCTRCGDGLVTAPETRDLTSSTANFTASLGGQEFALALDNTTCVDCQLTGNVSCCGTFTTDSSTPVTVNATISLAAAGGLALATEQCAAAFGSQVTGSVLLVDFAVGAAATCPQCTGARRLRLALRRVLQRPCAPNRDPAGGPGHAQVRVGRLLHRRVLQRGRRV